MSDKKLQPEEESKPVNPETPEVKASPEETTPKSESAEKAPQEADTLSQTSEAPPEEEVPQAEAPEAAPEEVATTEETAEVPVSEELPQEVAKEIDNEEEEASTDQEEAAQALDYHSLSQEELLEHLKQLLLAKPVQDIKHEVEEIRSEFGARFNEEQAQKKEEFVAGGGNLIDFHYSTPLRKNFNSLYFDYKEKRNHYYQNLKKDLQANYEKRQELIEELKGLLNAEENINTTYKHFKEIQDRWHVAGQIPRDKYNTVWNTYRHHVENFYDFLHLNREFRDLDFKHNLEQKLKIVSRAEELSESEDSNKSFRELQMLHKMWKEEIGPVAKEHREEIWQKFSAATKKIHDKRQAFLKDMDASFEENLQKKEALVAQIKGLAESTKPNHRAWQQSIQKIQKLRDEYFEIGKVPRNKAKEIWNEFKESTRNFNKEKNGFYKNQKKEQFSNLAKKRELIKIAEENKDSDDFEVVTALMKKIQNDWKAIGHVPRKDSDSVWKSFKDACNHYFDRLHSQRNQASKEEQTNLEEKTAMLKALEGLELSGDQEQDLQTIQKQVSAWKNVGRVPFKQKGIDKRFNKIIDGFYSKLNLGKEETEMIRFESKISNMAGDDDPRRMQKEEFFIGKKISETKDSIRQLENNLGFFQNAGPDNPLVKDVHDNINKQKQELEVWQMKQKKIRALRKR